jgi:adenylate cyclase class 2
VRVTQDKLKNTTEKSVTMKKLASDNNGVKAFDEQTVIIDNEKAMFKLFESLNLSLKELVEKVRVSYLYKGCLFEFDELKRTNRTDIYLEIESPQPAMLNSMLAELKNNNLYE